jgi:hypothetical protein
MIKISDNKEIINNIYMKRPVLITVVFLCFHFLLNAQGDSIKLWLSSDTARKFIYKTWISLINRQNTIKGVLYEVNDSSVFVSNSLLKKDYSIGKYNVTKISFSNIDLVKTRMKNSVRRGALIGFVTGFAVGGLIGLISGDDSPGILSFSAKEKALLYGIPLAVGGTGVGELIGSIKIKIPINGSMDKFNRNKSRLKKYTIR